VKLGGELFREALLSRHNKATQKAILITVRVPEANSANC
jgi:hypothetical protein